MVSPSATDELLMAFDEGVLVLTLNRPDRLNAISGPMLRQLSVSLSEANVDPDVRCIILTGAGRGFCSGLDLKEQMTNKENGVARRGYQLFDLHSSPPVVINRMDKPVICALTALRPVTAWTWPSAAISASPAKTPSLAPSS